MSIADRKHGLVIRKDVADAKLSSWQWRARLAAGDWIEAAPGVWHHRSRVVDWELRLRAGLLHLGDDAAIFGRAAAAWWGLDGASPDAVEFVVPRRRRERALILELLLDSGGESYLERRFLRLMREHGVRRPTCQVVHQRPDGGRVIRVDFQFPGTLLIVEVSGRLGHASDRDRTKAARRRNELVADGWDVREFTTLHVVEQPQYVVATVVAALAQADLVAS